MVVGAREVIDREFFKVLLDGFDEKLVCMYLLIVFFNLIPHSLSLNLHVWF